MIFFSSQEKGGNKTTGRGDRDSDREKSLLGHAVQACEQAAREGFLNRKLYMSGSLIG